MSPSVGAPDASSIPGAPEVVHQTPGMFGDIFVVDEGDLRILRFGSADGMDQTVIDRSDPARVPMPYLQAAALGAYLAAVRHRALMIGFGAGGFSRFLGRQFPDLVIDGVDIDPAVLAVARTHFGLVEGPHLRVHAADGAAYVEKLLADGEEGVYDIIHLDAYTGDGIPAHLTSPAFFGGISRLLSSSGVAILNLGVDDPEEEQQIETRFARAFVSRCAQVRVLDDENLIRFAGHHPPPSQDEMRRIARALDEQERLPFNLEIIAYSRTGCADGS